MTSIIHVLPLGHGDLRQGLQRTARIALFVTSSEMRRQVPHDTLALLYDLTPAEIRIFELVSGSMSATTIAETQSVAKSTVRSHLLKIFDKTDCHRQADIVRLAASLAISI